MKNFWLFTFLVSLLVLTYFFQELKDREVSDKEEEQSKPIKVNFSKIERYSSKFVDIKKGEKGFETSLGFNVDDKDFTSFLEKLSGLQVVRRLSPEERKGKNLGLYLSDDPLFFRIETPNEKWELYLGYKVALSDTFYIRILHNTSEEVVIADFLGGDPYVVNKGEENKSQAKYQQISTLLSLSETFFINRRLIPEDLVLNNMMVDSFRNRSYYVNFETHETAPGAFEGLEYRVDFMDKIQEVLKEFKAIEVRNTKVEDLVHLKEKVSEIKLNFKEYSLELYRSFHEERGYFVKTSKSPLVYQLDQKRAQIFFLHVQNYWRKYALSGEFLKRSSSLSLSIEFEEEKFDLEIPPGKNFEVFTTSTDKKKPNSEKFLSLFQFLAGETQFSEATRVSLLSETKKKIYADKPGFTLHFPYFKLQLVFEKDEILVVHHKNGLVLHYVADMGKKIGAYAYDYFQDY